MAQKNCLVFPLPAWALMVALASLFGCGRVPDHPPEVLETTNSHLKVALEAWKKGDKQAKLLNISPAIDFQDEDWKGGFKLLDYEISKTDGKQTELPRCWVKLSLQNRQGKKLEKNIVYEMKNNGKITIARDPYL